MEKRVVSTNGAGKIGHPHKKKKCGCQDVIFGGWGCFLHPLWMFLNPLQKLI